MLTEDEKELGVCLVDIGGGTTDIAVFTEGAIRHTAVIPIAGDQITNDIAMALRTPTTDAEDIKIAHGMRASRQLADPDEMIEVPGLGERGPRTLSRQALAAVIEPRVEELFSLVQQVVRESGYEELLSSGIVLTGGASMMQGMVELGEEIFLKPVRLGVPEYAGGLADVVRNPRYSTALGLLLEGARSSTCAATTSRVQDGSVKASLAAHEGMVPREFLTEFAVPQYRTCSSAIARCGDDRTGGCPDLMPNIGRMADICILTEHIMEFEMLETQPRAPSSRSSA